MKLVILLRSPAASPLIAQAEVELRQRGYDVCVAPCGENGGLREGVLRSLLLVADALVAFWSPEDLAEPWFSEIVVDAKRAKKLVGGGDSAGIPGLKGFKRIEPRLEALIGAVSARVGPSQNDNGAKVSVEYADLRRAAAAGDARAWRGFLSAHPDGAFRPLAEAEREIASTPTYRSPQQEDAGETQSAPWRLGHGWSPWAAPAGGFALLAVAVGALVLARQPLLTAAPNESSLGPPSAQAVTSALLPSSPPVETIVASESEPPPQTPEPTQVVRAGATQVAPEHAASVGDVALIDELRPRQSIQAPLPIAQAPPPPRTERISQSVLAQNAFDRSQVEPALRSVVEQARRRQRYAEDRARGSSTSHELSATGARYQGEWNGGANGLGVAHFANGDRYAGSWRQSQPSGMGVLRMRNGARYEGEFADGAPTGRGVFWRQDGTRLTGSELFRELVAASQASENTSLQ
jgi:hypothetical protein